MDKQLKIFALEYVKLHDNLTKGQKLAIGNFVMEASNDQVAYMLLTGEVKRNLNQEDVDRLNENILPLKVQIAAFWYTGILSNELRNVGVAFIVAIVAGAALLAYKKISSAAFKTCKGKKGVERTNCLNKFKLDARKAKIKFLEKGLASCSKSKDPAECKAKLQAKINKEKAKMGAL